MSEIRQARRSRVRRVAPLLRWTAAVLALALGCAGEPQPCAESPAPAPTTGDDKEIAALVDSLAPARPHVLDRAEAERLSRISLACVDREYPNKTGDVVDGDETVKPPRELHPAFFGCFDWHSAVHGHWAMVRLLGRFPEMETAGEIRAVLDRHLSPENIAAEVRYFKGEHHELYERPYGWGWLLRLAAELRRFDDPDAARWAAALDPLVQHISSLTFDYLDRLSLPVRAGTHHSTAYALTHIRDYAELVGDDQLVAVIDRRARDFYGADTDCPTAYEPSGEDFISPCLVEADLMRRVLPSEELVPWLDRFLPPLASERAAPVREPPEVRDRHDPKIGHLIGLMLQRAAAYQGIGSALPESDPRRRLMQRLAAVHREAGLAQMEDSGYGGAHWLASFAIYLLTEAGPYPGIAAARTAPPAAS